jgi:hypothetical protein
VVIGNRREPRVRRGSWALAGTAALLLAAHPQAAHGQARVLETHGFEDPEGKLLAFYAASMAFTPAGIAERTRLGLGIELTHIPYLNKAQRRPSIDKPEATNLAPIFPRPRVGLSVGSWFVEASWIPPVKVFDVTANVVSGAITGPAWQLRGFKVSPRVWGTIGRVKGTITCAASEMVGRGADLDRYYATVCHGRESEDWFDPRMLAAELIGTAPLIGETITGYAGAGARLDRTRFDIGVQTLDGARDADHPVLELEATRPHVTLGVSWIPRPGLATGLEAFYAPGSLLTARATWRWSPRP